MAEGAKPVCSPVRHRYLMDEVLEQTAVHTFLRLGVVEHASSPLGACNVLVRKKGRDYGSHIRFSRFEFRDGWGLIPEGR